MTENFETFQFLKECHRIVEQEFEYQELMDGMSSVPPGKSGAWQNHNPWDYEVSSPTLNDKFNALSEEYPFLQKFCRHCFTEIAEYPCPWCGGDKYPWSE